MSKKRSYGGRYPLREDDRKSEVLKVRLTKSEVELIKSTHHKSYTKSFSALIRHLLFERAIHVEVSNTSVRRLSDEISQLQSQCNKILKTKNKELDQFRPALERMQETLSQVKIETDKFKHTELYLTDLRDIDESEKRRHYPFYE